MTKNVYVKRISAGTSTCVDEKYLVVIDRKYSIPDAIAPNVDLLPPISLFFFGQHGTVQDT